jgi:hypothetical protein
LTSISSDELPPIPIDTIPMKLNPQRLAMSMYAGFIFVIMPLLAILRVLRIADPAELQSYVLPFLLGGLVVAFGPAKVLAPRSFLQYVLLLVFAQAAIIGGMQLESVESLRDYFSHLFQISSAYAMFGIGWLAIDKFGHAFWRRWTTLALAAILLGSVSILLALSEDRVDRLYTPAYGLIFVMSFSFLYSKKKSVAAYAALLVSNKRAVILASLIMPIYSFVLKSLGTKGGKYVITMLVRTLAILIAIFFLGFSAVRWADSPSARGSSIATAIEITSDRMSTLVSGGDGKVSLDDISSGRLSEVNAALSQAEWWHWIVGAGAGHNIQVAGALPVQNIHFSPLSITLVYGAPFAIVLYVTFSVLLLKAALRKGVSRQTTTERMAPLYLLGAVVHSFFAYSLFIDFLVFFFAGVLAKNQSNRGSIVAPGLFR